MLCVYVKKLDMNKMLEWEREYLSRLPAWRREKAERLVQPACRMVSAGAWLLAEQVLLAELGLSPADYRVVFSEKGRPEIRLLRDASEEVPSVYFSLSHTGYTVACAAAPFPLGLDMEQKEDPGLRVAGRMFTEPEKERLFKAAEEEKQAVFRDIWTEKESYLKFTGEGLSCSLKCFYKDPLTGEVLRNSLPQNCFIRSVRIPEAGSLSVCTEDPNLVLDIVTGFEL